MEIAIIGGGTVGLALALALDLHRRGLSCRVYDGAPEVKELGVGITLPPHAMRELSLLGLQETIEPHGIENAESRFFNRFGQLIYKEPRGRPAGYAMPESRMHRDAAGFHRHPGRGADRRPAVRQPGRFHQPRGIARAVGSI
jgi:5-methylphenazine-1-carboxylate 1-monooxygenase